MPSYETYTCDVCGEKFVAHQSARAAETGYCSPRCHTAGAGLSSL